MFSVFPRPQPFPVLLTGPRRPCRVLACLLVAAVVSVLLVSATSPAAGSPPPGPDGWELPGAGSTAGEPAGLVEATAAVAAAASVLDARAAELDDVVGERTVAEHRLRELREQLRVADRRVEAATEEAQQFAVAAFMSSDGQLADLAPLVDAGRSPSGPVLRDIAAGVVLEELDAANRERRQVRAQVRSAQVTVDALARQVVDAERRVEEAAASLEVASARLRELRTVEALRVAAALTGEPGAGGPVPADAGERREWVAALCPQAAPERTVPAGVDPQRLCEASVRAARTPEAAGAIVFAFGQLGARYSQPERMAPGVFDCSSLIMRAYEAAGVPVVSQVGGGWAPNSYYILGAGWAVPVPAAERMAGDLLYPAPGHVALQLADGWMLHTSTPGKPARVERAYTDPWQVRTIDPARLQVPVGAGAAGMAIAANP